MALLRRTGAMLFFALVAHPVLLIATGLRVLGREHLPRAGPAVVVANHNSHLDVIALMSLFPLRLLHKVRPVAAADHFTRPGPLGWLARVILNIIPIDRSGGGAETAIAPVRAALDRGDIVVLFPEGTRGDAGSPGAVSPRRLGTGG